MLLKKHLQSLCNSTLLPKICRIRRERTEYHEDRGGHKYFQFIMLKKIEIY